MAFFSFHTFTFVIVLLCDLTHGAVGLMKMAQTKRSHFEGALTQSFTIIKTSFDATRAESVSMLSCLTAIMKVPIAITCRCFNALMAELENLKVLSS